MLSYSKSNSALYLDNNTPTSKTFVDIYAPFSLTIDPRYIELPKKVRMIEYIWGDGTTDTVTYFPDPNHNIISQLAYYYDVGNPLNYIKTKVFYSKDLNLSVYNVTINFYCFTLPNVVKTFNLTLNLKNPDLAYNDNSFFYEFHLIKNKMYGPDDKILYTFQSQNDDYILMSNVDWKLKPTNKLPVMESLNLPYKLLKPFEIGYTNNTNISAL
jgi:hypothetical protein